jgi:ATP-dependent Lon protease
MDEKENPNINPDILDSDLVSIDQVLPKQLYIVPIRYRPIFPGIITPLIISQGRFSDAVDKVIGGSRAIGLVLLKQDEIDDIKPVDLYMHGTAAKILKKINLPDGGVNVLINSVKRFRITNVINERPHLITEVEYLEDEIPTKTIEIKALTRSVLSQLKMLSENNPLFTEEMKLTMVNVDEPGKIADFVTSILNLEKEEYQEVLETINVRNRLERVLMLLQKELEVVALQKKIQTQINEKIDKQQRDFYLREQLKAIKQELGIEEDERTKEVNEMKKKVDELQMQGEVRDKVLEEIEKLSGSDTNSAEFTITRTYLDVVLSLPWNIKSEETIDLDKAEKILNHDHYGLEDVKKRIVEFLAVRKLKPDARGSIICLVGPPGVGKTSLGKSIARSLSRKFFRMSLGGMRDEAEIKGHRKTYVGAMPGKIIQGIKVCKTRNPVFMLDEIDKLGASFQGDPASALLEVLDPEQNAEFRDHYLDLPFNLSDVFFITTANTLDSIPPALRDRMETIRLSGYIMEEKFEIARRYLLPKQLERHGLDKNAVSIDKIGFLHIITNWAREAGVRTLERHIETICRKTATLVAKGKPVIKGVLDKKVIREYLGPEIFTDEETLRIDRPGIVNGLAWTSLGGATLTIESATTGVSKNPGLKITGQLGEVMTESANIAYSYIQHHLKTDEEAKKLFSENIIHLHVPAGATPKDGPSAGITMATSLYSLATGSLVKSYIAMTGELTLTGRVFPIGGLKEKMIAAKRAGIKEIIIPKLNMKDLDEIPAHVKRGIKIHPVEEMSEVLKLAFVPHKGKAVVKLKKK